MAVEVFNLTHDVERLSQEVGINAKVGPLGETLLHLSVNQNEAHVVALLLAKRVAVNATNSLGQTALDYLINYGEWTQESTQILDMLLAHQADVNRVDIQNHLPLFRAIRLQRPAECLIRLIEAGSRLLGARGTSFLHIYGCHQNYQMSVVLSFVARGMDVNQTNSSGETPLHCLIKFSPNQEIDEAVVGLKAMGAKIDIQNKEGSNPLMTAITKKSPIEVLRLLVPDKDGINVTNSQGYSALALALTAYERSSTRDQILTLFAESGANFRGTSTQTDCSLLSSAVRFNYSLPQLQFILEKGASPDPRVIGVCLKESRPDVALLLLKSNPTLPLKDQLPDALLLLVNSVSALDKDQSDLWTQFFALFKILITDYSIDVNYVGEIGCRLQCSLLHLLIIQYNKSYSTQLFDYMLSQSELNLDIVCDNETPLTYALSNGVYDIAEKLIINCCDVSKCDLKNMALLPGLTKPLELLFNAGYSFPSSFGTYRLFRENSQPGTRDLIQRQRFRIEMLFVELNHLHLSATLPPEELKAFKSWLKEKTKEVPLLQRIAGNSLRKIYRNQMKGYFEEKQFPESFKRNILIWINSPRKGEEVKEKGLNLFDPKNEVTCQLEISL